jgi:hypothetical protein
MKCHSKQILLSAPAFSLVEVVTALIILTLISSSVLVVINRCMASTADSALRMQAFEVARDNMETLLSKDSVNEMVEYGSSDKHPEIQWKTAVEAFYEPVTEQMWVRAICSAEYADTTGDVQTIELTHWLTGLTKEQIIQMIEEKQKEKGQSAEEVIETAKEAADYAGVDAATIQQWVENGMPKTENGFYIKNWLDLYARTNGEPTAEDKERLMKKDADLEKVKGEQDKQEREGMPDEANKPNEASKPDEQNVNTVCGHTREEIMQMPIDELYQLLLNCDQF